MKKKAATAGFTLTGVLIILNYIPGFMPHIILSILMFLLSTMSILLRKQFKTIPLMLISVSAFFACVLYTASYIFTYIPMLRIEGKNALITAEITDEPYETDQNIICVLSPKSININGKNYETKGKITAFFPKAFKGREFDIIKGDFKLTRIKNKDGYDAVRQNRAKSIFLNANPRGKTEIVKTNRKPLYFYAVAVRKFIRNGIIKNVSGEEAALTNGIVLGDKTGISQDTADNFKNTGLSHALAVSGFQVTFLAGFLLMLFDFFKVRRRIAYILSILSCITVMAVTGFTPSVMRAGIMSIIMFAGGFIYEEADPINSIGLTLILLCSINPFGAVDLGLILSVLSTLGIFTVALPLNKLIEKKFSPKRYKKISFELIGAFTSTLGATLFTAPVILISMGNISLISIPANMLTIFPISLCFMSGIMSAVFSFCKPFALFLGLITKLIAKYLLCVTELLGSFSFSNIYAGYGYIYIWLIFIMVLGGLYMFFRKREKPRVIIAICLAVIVLCTGILSDAVLKKDLLEIEAVNVGNGDSIIMFKNGHVAVIDCGGRLNAYKSTLSALKEHNIKCVDILIISHLHEDHAGNADELINSIKVRNVILPPYSDSKKLRENIEKSAFKSGAKIYTAYKDFDIDFCNNIKFKILTRHINQNVVSEDDFNNNSLVVTAQYNNFSALFSGDIEKDAETKLLKLYPQSLDIDLLKIAHHGSATSSNSEFLAKTTPKAAVISVGVNTYGQPSAETLKRLLNIGAMIYNTEESGNIRIFSNGTDDFRIFTDK